ncbi:MAG: sulfotransferase family 2 domain-containing protein [Verrucomicrobia bacterium]|jgi:hypothetical protein|nr:sulfotransferase family 2 domain-containing protein [Verrucomicrobiota bacterium]
MNGPNCIGIGSMKAGSTYLHSLLKKHPDVFTPEAKEIHFFDNPHRLNKPEKLDEYLSLFEPPVGFDPKIRMEYTPNYMFSALSAIRIYRMLPGEKKFIATIRNPFERLISHYFHNIRNGRETGTLSQALNNEYRLRLSDPLKNVHFAYIAGSMYYRCLEPFVELFGRESLLIIKFEDLVAQTQKIFSQVTDFLEIDSMTVNPDLGSRNAGSKAQGDTFITEAQYAMLSEIFRHDLQQTQRKLGVSVQPWVKSIDSHYHLFSD